MQIYSLIPKIMSEVGSIEKGRTNKQQGYSFRGIDDVYSALQPLLAKHGVFFAPKVLTESREEKPTKTGGMMMTTVLKVQFTFYAPDASHFEVVTVGEAMDSGDKSANKAMSAALKYACLQLFCIPTDEDNDTENHSPEIAPRSSFNTTRPAATPVAANNSNPSDPGNHRFPMVGSFHKGKTFNEVGKEGVRREIERHQAWIKNNNGKLYADWAATYTAADQYLGETNEDAPF